MTRDLVHEFEVATQRWDEFTEVLHTIEKAVNGWERERQQLIRELLQNGYKWVDGKWIIQSGETQ